jgi:putative salt-induced outer membrane protein YdiY
LALVLAANDSQQEDSNTTVVDPSELIKVEDTSGLSEDEVRQIAKKIDKKKQLEKAQKKIRWEELSPTPIKSDWVQTKSGEWFRGTIKALYDDKLEFDSDEIGLYTFDFDDIKAIKSHQIISVNVENLALVSGILRLDGDNVVIIQGDTKYEFKRSDIISFAPDTELEKNYWSGKITFNFDVRSGNSDQLDYAAQIHLKRRTAVSNLLLDYLGRISYNDKEEIANDHRINEKYDRYITRYFFWTPLFSEYYTDKYKNIRNQITLGMGLGYTLIDTKDILWSFSGGPAVVYTEFYTVEDDKNNKNYSPALEISTKYEQKLTSITDFTYDYKLTLSNKESGIYKHHMILKFENELLTWLDIDVTGIWDYVNRPQPDADGVIPKRNDYQFLLGLGIEF